MNASSDPTTSEGYRHSKLTAATAVLVAIIGAVGGLLGAGYAARRAEKSANSTTDRLRAVQLLGVAVEVVRLEFARTDLPVRTTMYPVASHVSVVSSLLAGFGGEPMTVEELFRAAPEISSRYEIACWSFEPPTGPSAGTPSPQPIG